MKNLELQKVFSSMRDINNQLGTRNALTPEQIKQNKIKRLRDDYVTAKNKVLNSPIEALQNLIKM